jgi:uncharacterized coiled-coil protein SlyX
LREQTEGARKVDNVEAKISIQTKTITKLNEQECTHSVGIIKHSTTITLSLRTN